MDHAEAQREMLVEKYLLGELAGEARDRFEEHLFECSQCADELQNGVAFAEAVRAELPALETQRARVAEKRSWFDFLIRPQWMAPALAACLLTIGYQSFVRMPALQQQLAEADAPSVPAYLSMSSGAVRGGELQKVVVPRKAPLVITTELPPQPERPYVEYLCSLYSPSGALIQKQIVPAASIGDTIPFVVPAASVQAGRNTMVVQGAHGSIAGGATLEDLVRHDFFVETQK